jgi:cell division septation protein DedD
MASGKRSSAGERVLEGRHVIGLFFLMLLFSGVFFSLGYVMGRNQFDSQVRAASRDADPAPVLPLKNPTSKANKSPVSTPDDSASAPSADPSTAPASSEWEFYRAGEKKATNDHLKQAPPTPIPAPKTIATSAKGPLQPATPTAKNAPAVSSNLPSKGSYLQVAALRSESDALSLANDLRKKKFPAGVLPPQGDKYYRVQVGPYTDQKAMQTAKKGLETAGFKAIIKH